MGPAVWEGTGESAAQAAAEAQAEPWRETYFEAAVDAAEGRRWLSDVVRGDPVGPLSFAKSRPGGSGR